MVSRSARHKMVHNIDIFQVLFAQKLFLYWYLTLNTEYNDMYPQLTRNGIG